MALGIGIIGGGFNAQFHIRAFLQVRDCYVLGIVSNSDESALTCVDLCKELQVGDPKIYKNVESMAADEAIHAIWICAPNEFRVRMMKDIVAGNKNRKQKLRGIACEKPLARTFPEALEMLHLATSNGIPTGYLENQVFAPDLARGKELLWKRAVTADVQRPYLARCAEEHSGPHKAWFWDPTKQGGGVLNDMMCHCVLASRFLLTKPGKKCSTLIPVSVTANVASLKWTKPPYVEFLMENMNVDYKKTPAEDYAHAVITYKDHETGRTVITEATTSWSFVGAGLRLSFELLGPEYSLKTNTLNSGAELFLSRNVKGQQGEDLLEKQNAESGVMPIVPDEAHAYGYCWENRHFVQSFLQGEEPLLTFEDGVQMSAEAEKTIYFKDIEESLHTFTPAVAKVSLAPLTTSPNTASTTTDTLSTTNDVSSTATDTSTTTSTLFQIAGSKPGEPTLEEELEAMLQNPAF